MDDDVLQKVISLAKRRGFIFPNSDIYGGMANTFDYGPLGVELFRNVTQEWWRRFVQKRPDIVGIDAALIMNPKVWEASGHLEEFVDPLVEDEVTHERYRLDHVLEDQGVHIQEMSFKDMVAVLEERDIRSPKGNRLVEPQHFNLMLETFIGAVQEKQTIAYLRPETAQAMFVNFKNVVDSTRVQLPFGIAQVGKSFRNEITPGNYIFRTREFNQMEVEYFIREEEWTKHFEDWLSAMKEWVRDMGVDFKRVHYVDIPAADRAHYSQRTLDIEYDFPFGRKELYGLAYRGDYDLKQHMEASGEHLTIDDPHTQEKILPHVIEPSFGVDRSILVLLLEAYSEDPNEDGSVRTVLKLPIWVAPYKCAILPLVAHDEEVVAKAQKLFQELPYNVPALYDDNGSIGRRYRRNDEIGTPLCITVDKDTLKDDIVTVRDRDSKQQVRAKINEINNILLACLKGDSIFDSVV